MLLTSVLSMPLMQACASSFVLNVMKAKPLPGLKKSVTSPYFSTFKHTFGKKLDDGKQNQSLHLLLESFVDHLLANIVNEDLPTLL